LGCRGEKEKAKKAINGLKVLEELHAEILQSLYTKGQDLYNLIKHFLDVGIFGAAPLNILHNGIGAIQDRELGDLLAKTKSTLASARKLKQLLVGGAEGKDRPRTTKREREREREIEREREREIERAPGHGRGQDQGEGEGQGEVRISF
jgi:hypothetical protein